MTKTPFADARAAWNGQGTTVTAIPPSTALSDILHDIRAFIHRYVRIGDHQATLIALWIAMTHAIDAFDFAAYLHITSPLPECGKSRVLEVLEPLVAKPWLTSRVSAAVLMRKVDKDHPTLLLDESDAQFGADEQYAEALRGLLNSGFHRSGVASCCVGQGTNLTFKDFHVFGPKAIAGIGRLPATVESRSVPIVMKRRTKAEPIQKWRRRDAWADATVLRDGLAAALHPQIDVLRAAPAAAMPDGLSDRCEDVLEPLFQIADLAGGEWPQPARDAAVALMGEAARQAQEADLNLSLELLADIQQIFQALGDPEAIATKTLLEQLVALEDRPWATIGQNEKPMTGHRLSRLLKSFDILPAGSIYVDGKTARAYRRVLFEEAFSRYLVSKRENVINPITTGLNPPFSKRETDPDLTLSKTPIDPDKHWSSHTLTLSNPDHEERGEQPSVTAELQDRGDELFRKGWKD